MTSAELKAERNRLSLSVHQMAERLHLSHGTYLKYEYGQRAIPDDLEWRVVLAQRDPCAVALLLLEQTRGFGWPENLERQVGTEIMGMIDHASLTRSANRAPE